MEPTATAVAAAVVMSNRKREASAAELLFEVEAARCEPRHTVSLGRKEASGDKAVNGEGNKEGEQLRGRCQDERGTIKPWQCLSHHLLSY